MCVKNIEHLIALILVVNQGLVLHCASAAVHSHSVDTAEREADGSYRHRDHEHYGDSGHNPEFDHEAILGSVKEAAEYDHLSPDESKHRLQQLLPKMDINKDRYIDKTELKKWILNSFSKLSEEEAQERLSETDDNRDGVVSWSEYLRDSFGVDREEDVQPGDSAESGMLVAEEKEMWAAADLNKDGFLDLKEFEMFTVPEEHPAMHWFLLRQTLRDKDKDQDGRVDFDEFIGGRGGNQETEWMISEKDKFEHELDLDKDGVLDEKEILKWIIPDNDEIASEEVEHLFESADENNDNVLSYDEVLDNHDIFVGSEATDFDDLRGHFDDEL